MPSRSRSRRRSTSSRSGATSRRRRARTGRAWICLDNAERRALSKASGAAGGFAVPQDFYEQIVSARRAAGVLGQLATPIETDNGQLIPVPAASAHGTGTWTAKSAAYPTSGQDDTFTQAGTPGASLGAFKGSTKVLVSEELAQDAGIPFDEYLSGELGGRLSALEEAAFAVGDGTGKPLGIAHASSGITAVTAATGSATAFKLADLKSAYKALPGAYRPFASWLLHPDDFAELAALTDSAGGLVLPTLQNDPPTLLGRPVALHPDLPAPAANARSAAFGDFRSGYMVRRVRRIGVQRLDELASDNGQLVYRAYHRVDGRPILTDAIRLLVHSAT